jgi:hypothetical protein
MKKERKIDFNRIKKCEAKEGQHSSRSYSLKVRDSSDNV